MSWRRMTSIRGSAGGVGEERHLPGPLDGERDLALVPPAGAGDPPRADLALPGDVAPALARVLVINLGDLPPAEVAVQLPDRPFRTPAPVPVGPPVSRGHPEGMSSSGAR